MALGVLPLYLTVIELFGEVYGEATRPRLSRLHSLYYYSLPFKTIVACQGRVDQEFRKLRGIFGEFEIFTLLSVSGMAMAMAMASFLPVHPQKDISRCSYLTIISSILFARKFPFSFFRSSAQTARTLHGKSYHPFYCFISYPLFCFF